MKNWAHYLTAQLIAVTSPVRFKLLAEIDPWGQNKKGIDAAPLPYLIHHHLAHQCLTTTGSRDGNKRIITALKLCNSPVERLLLEGSWSDFTWHIL